LKKPYFTCCNKGWKALVSGTSWFWFASGSQNGDN
jgi:hypothetical protein